MKSMIFLMKVGAIAVSFFNTATAMAEDFKLVKTESGISLYEKWIATANGEKVREYKITFSARTNVTGVVNLLTDQNKGRNWNQNAKEYRVIKSGTNDSWVNYIKYDVPWPLSDQDCCLAYQLNRNNYNRSAEISFRSIAHQQFPVKSSVNRINGAKGKWIMEDKGNGNVNITYLLSVDRSSNVPRVVADPIVQGQLFKTITNFITLLEQQA